MTENLYHGIIIFEENVTYVPGSSKDRFDRITCRGYVEGFGPVINQLWLRQPTTFEKAREIAVKM